MIKGSKMTEEQRARVSRSLLGNKRTLGHKLTEEHKAKIGKASLGRQPYLGRTHTEETKRICGLASKNAIRTVEWKRKIGIKTGQFFKGRKMSSAQKEAIRQGQLRNNRRTYKQTWIERWTAEQLILKGITFFHNFGIEDICNVDFYLPKHNIIIECDGCFWHYCPICGYGQGTQKDRVRTARLKSLNYQVYRIWEHEFETFVSNPSGFWEAIGLPIRRYKRVTE